MRAEKGPKDLRQIPEHFGMAAARADYRIHVFNRERFVSGTDISEIFAQLDVEEATHAFYLGKER